MKSTKICSRCKLEKPIDRFYKHSTNKGGFRYECIDCCNLISLNYSRANPERVKAIKLKSWLNWAYGVSPEKVEELKKKQNNLCAICEEDKPLVVDHDHSSNKIRGLLCNTCNLALGLIKDSLVWPDKAKKYLLAYNTSMPQKKIINHSSSTYSLKECGWVLRELQHKQGDTLVG